MASENPEYRRAVRSELKEELQDLLDKLSANGEETLVLTAAVGESAVASPIYSRLGGDFFYIEKEDIEEMGRKFYSYCQDFSSSGETTDSPRKRKLSTGEGGDEDDNYIAMEEVVFVTEPEVNSSESTVKVAVANIEEVGSETIAHDETLQQVTITQNNDGASSKIVLVQNNDDQSQELWTDYTADKTAEAEGINGGTEEPEVQAEFRTPQVQETAQKDVDVSGSPQVKVTPKVAKSSGIMVRKEGLNKFTTVPLGGSQTPKGRKFVQQKIKVEPVKTETQKTPKVKTLEMNPLTRYINNMATGKSIMIRAGEDCFEEIETISIADTHKEQSQEMPTTPVISESNSMLTYSQTSVESQMNVDLEATTASRTLIVNEPPEVIITDKGEKVHIMKGETNIPEETFDIPFEDMFDLLGKSCRCLVCGKIMLKRNRRYHWRFHTGATPYVCSYCPKKFYHPSNLKSHLFIHTARNK